MNSPLSRLRTPLLAPALAIACLGLPGCGGSPAPREDSAPPASEVLERQAEKGPVTLQVKVWPIEPRLSDLVDMEVVVRAEPQVELRAPAFGQGVGDFLIRDYSERPASGNERRFHYQLEPVHAGKHLIRSVAIEFTDRRPDSENLNETLLIETEPLELTVTSELGDGAPDLADLEPMLPPAPLPSEWSWVGWTAGLLLPLLAGIAWRVWRRRRPVSPPVIRRTPEEIAHEALTALLNEQLPSRGLFKEFYLRLTGIVRRYIEDTTGLRASEQTTEEFLQDMRSRGVFSPERAVRLAEFLEAADMVKYAGQLPGASQVDDAISRAREFVDLRPSREPGAVPRQ